MVGKARAAAVPPRKARREILGVLFSLFSFIDFVPFSSFFSKKGDFWLNK